MTGQVLQKLTATGAQDIDEMTPASGTPRTEASGRRMNSS